jgi:hypothetical protein
MPVETSAPEINLDDLSLYDVAVLTASSPAAIENPERTNVILTGKDIYIWAGAIAFLVSEKGDIQKELVLKALEKAITFFGVELAESAYTVKKKLTYNNLDLRVVERFLVECGFSEPPVPFIIEKADEARIRLEQTGLIEDPFSKKVLGILLSVISIFPVNFTSKTKAGETKIEALTWKATRNTDGNWTARIKVKELVEVITEELVPTIINVFDVLARGGSDVQKLEYILSKGVVDPDVSLWLGMLKDDAIMVKTALENGADPNILRKTIFEKYKDILDEM